MAQAPDDLFSVLTTVWNTPAQYLKVLAQSVLQQDYPGKFEWVILDNGCTDPATIAYLQGLRHPSVKLHRVKENLGIVGGMRYCLERACGRYVVPVDSDDYVYPDCLRILAWYLERHHGRAILYSDEDRLTRERFHDPVFKPDWDPVLFFNLCYIAHVTAFDRRRALALGVYNDDRAQGCHDWDTFTRFFLAGYHPLHVPEILYSWRLHPQSCAMNVQAKPYVTESQKHVLGKFLGATAPAGRYSVEHNPLFRQGPEWRFGRARSEPRPLLTLVLTTDAARGDARTSVAERAYPGHAVLPLSLANGLSALEYHAERMVKDGGWLHFVYEGVQLKGSDWPWEILTLRELYPATVTVAGCVVDRHKRIVSAGEHLGAAGDCACLDDNGPGHPLGYVTRIARQHSVGAASMLLAAVDPAFLLDFLGQDDQPPMSLVYLGAWLGAFARRCGRRVVYSPHVHGMLADPSSWQRLVDPAERALFARRHQDIPPDRRFHSPHLSMDPATPYALLWPGLAAELTPGAAASISAQRPKAGKGRQWHKVG